MHSGRRASRSPQHGLSHYQEVEYCCRRCSYSNGGVRLPMAVNNKMQTGGEGGAAWRRERASVRGAEAMMVAQGAVPVAMLTTCLQKQEPRAGTWLVLSRTHFSGRLGGRRSELSELRIGGRAPRLRPASTPCSHSTLYSPPQPRPFYQPQRCRSSTPVALRAAPLRQSPWRRRRRRWRSTGCRR